MCCILSVGPVLVPRTLKHNSKVYDWHDLYSCTAGNTCRSVYSMLEKNKTVTKFLNRMLAMSLRDQKLLFTYFSDTLVSLLAESHKSHAHF